MQANFLNNAKASKCGNIESIGSIKIKTAKILHIHVFDKQKRHLWFEDQVDEATKEMLQEWDKQQLRDSVIVICQKISQLC